MVCRAVQVNFGLRIADCGLRILKNRIRSCKLNGTALILAMRSVKSEIRNSQSEILKMRYGNRYQFGLTLLTGFFLLATLIAVLLYGLTPATPATRGPLLLTAFVAILLGALVCILFFLRWVLRPYRQLVGEAEKASVQSRAPKSRDEAEFVLETFQSVVAQLQEQRQALEQLSNQASKRADSAERFSERIVASVPSALIAFDGGGKSLVVNAPGRALLELDGELDGDALGQPVAVILHKLPELAEMVAECLHSGKIYRREEIETVTSEQIPRRLGATVAPIDLASDRGPRGALCLLTDITEVTQLREQVALKKNLESLGEMSAGLAHEFKNAIATLHGYVQLLQSLELDDKARGTASSLLNEVRNLSDMVTSFLNFARPQPLQLDEVNLEEVIADCASELAPLFEQANVELLITGTAGVLPASESSGILPAEQTKESGQDTRAPRQIHADGAPSSIRADERMLRQALLNLIRNAAEAIPEAQTDRRVAVVSSTELDRAGKDWALVEIKDTGVGIPAADLQRIFIPFFTTKATGHGVGLALAHRVVTQHGGTLTASNAKDGGAVFTVRLPL
jgi:signal transduction histidine kinase